MRVLPDLRWDALPKLGIVLFTTTLCPAQAGTLDPSFGDGGKLTTPFFGPTSDTGRSVVAMQADGKVVVAGTRTGDFALVRYDSAGALDPSFGNGGKVTTDFGGTETIYACAIQLDGKIVAAGATTVGSGWNDFALARYDSDGRLDTSFGGDGMVITSLGTSHDIASGLVLEPDGRIVVVGQTSAGTRRYDFGLVRYLADGTLDASFAGDGIQTVDFGSDDYGYAIVLQPDGRLVAAGRSYTSQAPAGFKFSLVRVHQDGTLDTSFGAGGGMTTSFGTADDGAYALALQADGRLVAAGFTRTATRSYDFAVVRYQPNGQLDTGFGSGGGTVVSFGTLEDRAFAAAVQPDGRIVVAGAVVTNIGYAASFALLRLDSQGLLDPTFGTGGTVTATMHPYSIAYALALQGDGGIIAAGVSYGYFGATGDFAAARFTVNGALDPSFGTNGRVTTDFGRQISAGAQDVVAMQADGKLIVAGYRRSPSTGPDFALARYNPDGSLDPSFGVGGIVTTDFSPSWISSDFIAALAIQADGKILAAGTAGDYYYGGPFLAVVRYNTDGSLDPTFGSQGKTQISVLRHNEGAALAILDDGRILVAGRTMDPFVQPRSFDWSLVRLEADGRRDQGFGTSGRAITDWGIRDATLTDMAVQADGRIVLVGRTDVVGGYLGALARYDSEGRLDPSFGAGGKVTIDLGAGSQGIRAVAQQADGKLVVVGAGGPSGSSDTTFFVARYATDGSLDGSFGSGGKVLTPFATYAEAVAVKIQGDGRIVVAGSSTDQALVTVFAVARYLPDGSLDASFGAGGRVTTGFGDGYSMSLASALELHAGRIIVAGTVRDTLWIEEFAVARYYDSDIRLEQIEALLRQVEGLAAAKVLNHGQTRALQAKLEAALQQIDRGHVVPALGQITALANQVSAFVEARILTESQGAPLAYGAAFLISLLS